MGMICLPFPDSKRFSDTHGLGRGGGSRIYFFENWPLPLTVRGFLPVLVRFQTHCTAPLPPFAGCTLGEDFSEKVGTVGELYKGKIMKQWGRTSPLMGSYPEW